MWNTIYHNSQRQETLWKKAPFRIGNLIISSFFYLRPNTSRPPCFVGKIYQEPILAIHSYTCQLCTSDTQVNLQLILLTLSIFDELTKKIRYSILTEGYPSQSGWRESVRLIFAYKTIASKKHDIPNQHNTCDKFLRCAKLKGENRTWLRTVR